MAADHNVRQTAAAQLGLEQSRLLVGAEQNRHLARRGAAGHQSGDLGHHSGRLGLLVLEATKANRAARGTAGLQPLGVATRIVRGETVRDLQDGRIRAIVLLEADDPSAGKNVLKLEDVPHFRPAPAVDRLVVVADDAERAVRPHERFGQRELRAVGVLVFVDLHVIEAALVASQHVRKLLEQAMREQEQVVEVDAAATLDRLLVAAIGGRRQHVEIVFDEVNRPLRGDAGRFPAADAADQVARAQCFVADANFAERGPRGRFLVAAIVISRSWPDSRDAWRPVAGFARRASETW